MGHASITTTLDLYGHLYPGEVPPQLVQVLIATVLPAVWIN